MIQDRGFAKKMVAWTRGVLCMLAPITVPAAPSRAPAGSVIPVGWKEFHSASGNCSMIFPADPEHISEKMMMPDEGFELNYDAYISAADQQTIFMLLVARYPEFVDQTYAQMSLEGFLN